MKRAQSRWLGRLAGVFACGLLACAQTAQGPPEPAGPGPGPLLWRAESPAGDATFFLVGSVHLGDRRMLELGEEIRSAYEASDELVVEVDLSRVDPAELETLTRRYALLPPPTTATLQSAARLRVTLAMRRTSSSSTRLTLVNSIAPDSDGSPSGSVCCNSSSSMPSGSNWLTTCSYFTRASACC